MWSASVDCNPAGCGGFQPRREHRPRTWRPIAAVATYRFAAGHVFDSESGEVRGPHATVRLEPQPAALLALLAEHAGSLVTHADIAQRIWGGTTHVNFHPSIHYGIRQIRSALGDTRATGLVENIPRRGYRLRRDALVPNEVAVLDRVGVAKSEPRRWSPFALKRPLVLGAGLAALIAMTMLVERRPNNHHDIALRMLKAVHDLVY